MRRRYRRRDATRTNERLKAFIYADAMKRGILLHPRHLWYVSTAHTEGDIDRSVDVVDEAMRAATLRHPELRRTETVSR